MPGAERIRRGVLAALLALTVLGALPALAGAANPPNSFVIGWQQYTKTGQSAIDRFATWRINSNGTLSSSPVYTTTSSFTPALVTAPNIWYGGDYDRSLTRRMQVTPDGRTLVVYGFQYNNYVLYKWTINADGTLTSAGGWNLGQALSSYVIAPSGRTIYAALGDGVYRLGFDGSMVRQPPPTGYANGAVSDLGISPNGRYLAWSTLSYATPSTGYGVYDIAAADGSLTARSAAGTNKYGIPSFSPNGSTFLLTTGGGIVLARAFDQSAGSFGATLSINQGAGFFAGHEVFWSTDSRYFALSGKGGGIGGYGCIYSCTYATTGEATAAAVTYKGQLMFDNESNNSSGALGKTYTTHGGAMSPDGDTVYKLSVQRSSYRSYTHRIDSYSFRNGLLTSSGGIQTCSDYYDAGNSQTPGRGDNCGGTFEIVATRPSLGLTAFTSSTSATSDYTNQSTWTYSLTFNASVTGLAKGDFTIGGTASGFAVSGVSGSGAGPYTVTVAKSVASPSEGTVILRLAANSVQDAQANTGPAAALADTLVGPTVTYDVTPPTVTITPPTSPLNTVTPAYSLDFSEPVRATDLATSDFAIASGAGKTDTFTVTSVTPSTGNTTTGTVNLTGTSAAQNGALDLTMTATNSSTLGVRDRAGNWGPVASAMASATVSFTPANTVAPTVVGTLGTGETLSVGGNTWTGLAPITFTYKWQSSEDGTSWSDVSGATASTYKIPTTGGGLYYRVEVTATNARGSASPVTSAGRGRVAISPVLLVQQWASPSKASLLTIRSDGTLDAAAPTSDYGGMDDAQYAVTTPDARFVYVISKGDDKIYAYKTDAGGGLTALATASYAVGDMPVSAAISGDGAYLYVVNRGPSNIGQYAIGRNGELTALSPATVTTPSSPTMLVANPAGTRLYVVTDTEASGNANAGRLRAYSIGASGQLSTIGSDLSIRGGTKSLAFAPSGTYLYTAYEHPGTYGCGFLGWSTCDYTGGMQHFEIGATGAATLRNTWDNAPDDAYSILVSPDGSTVWTVKTSDGTLVRYDVNPTNGSLSEYATNKTYDVGVNAWRLATSPDGAYLYVTGSSGGERIYQYAVGADGLLTALSPSTYAIGRYAIGPAWTPKFGVLQFDSTNTSVSGSPSALRAPGGSVDYTLTFTRPVTGLTADDFDIGGTAQGMSVGAISGSGAGPYTFTVSAAGDVNGTVELTLKANSVTDRFGTTGPSTATLWTTMRTAPTVTLAYAPPTVSAFTNTVALTTTGASGTPTPTTQAIAAGDLFYCAIVDAAPANAVKCWGANDVGQLGDGTTARRWGPVAAIGVTNATAIEASGSTACALIGTGATSTVKCWGQYVLKEDGTLGNASTPQTVPGLSGATAIAVAGGSNFCAIIGSGATSTVRCWGYNDYGRLGDGTQTTRTTPTLVSNLTGATDIATLGNSTCALLGDQTVKCWGGRIGAGNNPSPDRYLVPATTGITGASAIFGWANNLCVTYGSGASATVGCMGTWAADTVGSGRTGAFAAPVTIPGVSAVEGGTFFHTCYLSSAGALKCAGANAYGERLTGTASGGEFPSIASGISTATQTGGTVLDVAVGRYSTCVLNSTRDVKCAGLGTSGQLGRQLAAGALGSATALTVNGLDNCAATGAYKIDFSLTFAASVTGLSCTDIANTGTSSGWSAQVVSGSGAGPYVVRMTANTLAEGTVIPTLAADGVLAGTTPFSPGPATAQSGPTQTLALPVARSVPTTAGTVASGATLTVTPPTFGASPAWGGSPTPTLTYQWQVTTDGGATWSNATGAGATTASYTVAAADASKRHRAIVTATNLLGSTTEYSRQVTTSGTEAPGLVTFVRGGASESTSGTSLTFTATFSHVPQGLTAGDFRTTGTASGWSVQSLTGSGTGPYQITVGGSATGDGTVGLQLRPDSVTLGYGSYPAGVSVDATSGYTVTRVPPAVAFFSQTGSGAGSATYNLTFTSDIDASTLTAADITPASGWTVTGVTGTGAGPYTITLAGTGSPGATLGASSVANAVGTSGPASAAPATSSLGVAFTAPATPTTATGLAYTVTFSQSVSGIAAGDFAVTGSGSGTCVIGSPSASSGTSVTVTLNSCGEGATTLKLLSGSVVVGSGTGPAADVSADAVTRDVTAPTVASFTATTPVSSGTALYSLTFSEPVRGLTTGDVTLAGTSTMYDVNTAPGGWRVTSVTGSGAGPYTVIAAATTPTDGTVIPTLAVNAVNDYAGTNGPASTSTGTTVTYDGTAPTMVSLTRPAATTNATTLAYTLTMSEPVSGLAAVDFQIGGTATGWSVASVSPASGPSTTFTVNLAASGATAGTVIPTLRQNAVQDAAGNLGPAASQTGQSTTYDTTVPTVTAFAADRVGIKTGAGDSVTFTLTFSEAVTGVAAGDFSNTGSAGTCTFAPGSDAASDTRTVTVSGCADRTAGKTIIPQFAANGADDAAGNHGPATAFTVAAADKATYDGTAPAVASGGFTAGASAVNTTTATFSITFSEPVTGLDSTDFTVGGTSTTWTVTDVSGSEAGPYTVTVTGTGTPSQGTVTVSFNTNAVTDGATNAGASATQTSPAVTYDTVAPTSAATVTGGPSAGGEDNDSTPTFTFGGNGGGETHQCKIDSGSFATCTSPYTVSPALADGSHTLTVRTSDGAGNGSATETTRTWTLDTAPPTVPTIGSAVTTTPYPQTNATSRTISFVPDGAVEVTSGIPFSSTTLTSASIGYSSPVGTTVRCKVDSGAWATCAANPLALSSLAVGSHTVLFDTGSGTLETKVTWSVVASGGVDTRNAVNYYLADGTTSATQCKVDGGAYADCGTPKTFTGLAAGDHTATVSARDTAGNTSTATTSWTVDLTPPTDPVTISSGPTAAGSSSDSTPTFTFPSASGLSTECRVDSGAWAACTSPYTIAPASAVAVVSGQPSSRTYDTDASITVDTSSATLRCTVDGGTRDDTCDNPLILSSLAAGTHTVVWDTGASTTTTTVTWTVVTSLPVTTTPTAPTYSPDVALSDASHTFEVRYIDPAGNGGPASSRTWTVDTTAPATPPAIGSGPGAASSDSDPTPDFAFSGAGAGETYECKVDTGAWAACTSPYTAPTLGDGSHTFSTRIVDAAGNASTATTRTWTVDTVAPTTAAAPTRTIPASSPSSTTNVSVALSGAGAGETYQCSLDNGAWAACTSPFTASGLADGEHTLRTRTVDAAGNTGAIASASWTVDTSSPSSPPAPSGLPSGGTTSTSASGTLPTPSTGSTQQCNLDGAGWATCPSPLTYTGLSDGAHTLQTREVDSSGNTGPVTSTTWTVDTSPPAAPTSGAGPSTTADQTPAVTFTGEPGSTFECRVDGGSWSTCSSPYTPPSNLPNGAHSVEVRQIDGAGNASASTSSYAFTVDTASTAAEVGVTGTPTSPTNATTASLTATVIAGTGTIRCTVDGGAVQSPCPSPLALTGLAAGAHVVVFDTGASTAETAVRWLIDTTAPATPSIGQQPANPTNAATGTFAFSGDPNTTFQCKVDSGAYAACTSPYTTGALAEGSHTFSVKAQDAAGNLSAAATATWTIDTTPSTGTATLTAKPSATTTATSASFSFTLGTDGVSAQCSLDGAAWAACASPVAHSGLAEGSHTFSVRTLDAAGNVSTGTPTAYTWLVDTGPPTGTPTFSSQPDASSSAIRGTFAFSGASSPETYECRVDAGTWVACTSPYTTPALTEGAHTFNVRIVDPAGNIGANLGSATWTVDTTAPSAPTISGGSTGTIASTTGSVSFTAPPAGTTAQCRIDEGAWAACTSPVSFTGLADGAHTADVRFVDAAGNVGASSSRSWISDTTAPAVLPTIPTQIPTTTSDTSITIGVNAVLDRGESSECKLDSGAWAACTPPVSYSGLADGSHTFSTRTVDAAGNATDPVSVTWTVDTSAPAAPTISSGVTNGGTTGPTPTITVQTQAGDVVECRIDSSGGSPLAFGPCASPYTVAPALTAGAHTIEFRITDAAGNVGATTTVSFTVDVTPPPAPSIASGPSGTVATAEATFTFTDTEVGATFVCSLDGGAYAACTSPKTYTSVGADGSHTFSVKAADAYDNRSAATSRTWSVDTTGPQTPPTVTGAPSGITTSSTATLTVETNEAGATLQCSLNGGAYATCTSPYTVSGLADGTQTVRIRQVDTLGNPGTATTTTWTVDTIGPVAAPVVSGLPSGITAATSYTATFTGAAAGETYQCSTDGGATWSTCTSPQTASGLADGTQQFAVRLLDAPGNAGPAASFLWVIETGPPTSPPTTGATPAATSSTQPSFTFTGGTTTTFECRVDSGAWAACTSPFTPPSGLAVGSHTFDVRQINGTGPGPISTTTFVVDPSAPPEVAVSGTPSSPTSSTSATLLLTIESGSTLWCKIDDGAMAACSSAQAPSPLPAAGEPLTYTLALTGLAEGAHSVTVYQVDASGVRSSTTTVVWRVDTTNPVTPAIGSQPDRYTSATSAQFTFTAEPGTTSKCSIDGGDFVACTSPVSLSGLGEGDHSLSVRSTDAAGNSGPPSETATFTVDRTPPATAPDFSSGPDAISTAAVETFNFTLPAGPLNGAGAQCSYDDGAWTACTSPYTASVPTLGDHTLRVRAVDAAGNVGALYDTYTWTRVFPTTPPTGTVGVQINGGAEFATSASATLDLIWPSGASFVEISNTPSFVGAHREVISTRTAWTLDLAATPPTVYVRYLDAALAVVGDASYSDTIAVDADPPVVSAIAFERTASGVRATPTIADAISGVDTWHATLATASPGSALPAAQTDVEIAMTSSKTVYVRATDRAGNVSTWFSTAPASSLFASAPAPSGIVVAGHVIVTDTTPPVDDSGVVSVPLTCATGGGQCEVKIVLLLGEKPLGTSTVVLREGAQRDVPVSLSSEGKGVLAARGTLDLSMRVRATTRTAVETRDVPVSLEAPAASTQRLLRGKRATMKRAWVLAKCAGAAPLHCSGRVQLVTLRKYRVNGKRARIVLGTGAVKGAAGTAIIVPMRLNASAKTLLGRYGFIPVRAVWTLSTKARVKLKKGQKPYLRSKPFRIPTKTVRLSTLLVRQFMLPSGWRPAGQTPDVGVVFRGRTPEQIARIRRDLRSFLQVVYAGPVAGQWLTSEGYVYRDAAAAQRALEAVLDVAKSRGPIETARAFQFLTLPLPSELQAKGLIVTTNQGGTQRQFQFWCWRQVATLFCNRAPADNAFLLGQVTNQQLPIIKRNLLP